MNSLTGELNQAGHKTARAPAPGRLGSTDFRGTVDPHGDHPPAPGRYHLYASLACPLAHRVLIARMLKGLQQCIGVSVVDPLPDAHGWHFSDAPGCEPDFVNQARRLSELYAKARPGCTDPGTVPMLWDCERGSIVNNHPTDLLRLLNHAFDDFAVYPEVDLWPAALHGHIDDLNARLDADVDGAIREAWHAVVPAARGQALQRLSGALEWLDGELAGQRYLACDAPTEPDVRLFTTLVRFDAAYHACIGGTERRITEYRHLSGYLCDLYQTPGFGDTVNMTHIRQHFGNHRAGTPAGLLGAREELAFLRPHDRERLGAPQQHRQAG